MMRIILTVLSLVVFIGCSAETPEARYAGHLAEQPIGYQPEHLGHRTVASDRNQSRAGQTAGQDRRSRQSATDQGIQRDQAAGQKDSFFRRTPQITRSVGEKVNVTGRIVAGREAEGGTVKEILIWDGTEEFQLASADSRARMFAHLGQRVQLEGTVTRVGDGSTILEVGEYEILEESDKE